jgi:hypothetical protein
VINGCVTKSEQRLHRQIADGLLRFSCDLGARKQLGHRITDELNARLRFLLVAGTVDQSGGAAIGQNGQWLRRNSEHRRENRWQTPHRRFRSRFCRRFFVGTRHSSNGLGAVKRSV